MTDFYIMYHNIFLQSQQDEGDQAKKKDHGVETKPGVLQNNRFFVPSTDGKPGDGQTG